MDKFALSRKLELLATKYEKEAKSARQTGLDEFHDGIAHAYESVSRDLRKLSDEFFYSETESKYEPSRHAIRAFVHAGQPWPLSDETMKRILEAEDLAVLAKAKKPPVKA